MQRRSLLFISIVCLSAFSHAQSSDTLIYSIVSAGGEIKGFDKYWKLPDGSFDEWYQYNDRGRGDSLRINFKEDEEGFPISIKASGKDYMKNDVNEEFSWVNNNARWKNNAEDMQQEVSGKAFYIGLKANAGHMMKALKKNGNRIKLIPSGEAMLTVLEKKVLGTGAEEMAVWLVETKGFDLTPSYTWIDKDDLDFAIVNDWQSSIRKGYEKYIAELLAAQKVHESNFYKNLASTLTQKADEWVLIKDVSLFDAVQARLVPHKDVLIHNGTIDRIAEGNTIQNAKARSFAGEGLTILPGLWDMHVHVSDNLDGIFHIAAGVSHVRDMGNNKSLLEKIRQINDGEIIGPRVEIMSGFIDGAGPFAAPTGALINNVEEGKKAIREYAQEGYQQIKLYSSIKPEWVKPLIDEARKHHLRVAGHIPAFMTAAQAINAGYNEVTHMNMLVLNFFGDTVDTRSPLRFSLPAQKAATLDLHGAPMVQFVELMKNKKITVDPTLGVFEDLFLSRDKEISANFKNIVDHFPLQWQRRIKAGGGGVPVPEGMDQTYRQSFQAFLNITKMVYDKGIRIVPGTDGLPGFSLHRELELYVLAGIPANKVLQLATWGPANYTGKAKEFGSIEKGKKADFILVEGNPVENISSIRKVRWVMTQGKIYDPSKLYSSVSIQPF